MPSVEGANGYYPELPRFLDQAAIESLVTAALDSEIKSHLEPDAIPIVMFSGGVDSGLIAYRLSALGRMDTVMFNVSFGQNDKEAMVAREMANRLRLNCIELRYPGKWDVLTSPGAVYPVPFGDYSAPPAAFLASEICDRYAGQKVVVFDGTGADGCFGLQS